MNGDTLRVHIGGTVVARSDPTYEQVRGEMLWNQLQPARHPELIVRVDGEADIVEALRLARGQGLGVAVRGRGHSWCGTTLRNGTVLIDLSGLDDLQIDRATRSATAQPAVTGRQLSGALTSEGLAFPIGHCSPVPLSGYLLSGGMGWNSNTWGPACANLRAVELIMADGSRITASDTEHPDLLWAARGAGPCFFAVATRFHVQLQPLPEVIHTSTYAYPLECADRVAEWAATLTLPSDVELTLFLLAPAGSREYVCLLTATAFSESPAQAQRALQPLSGSPLRGRCLNAAENQPTPFDALLHNVDGMFPERHRYLADNAWTSASPGTVLSGLRERLAVAPSSKSVILCMLSGFAAPLPDMAFSLRDRTYVACYAIWDDPRADAANRAWFDTTVALLEQCATGHYIGECDIDLDPARAARAFTPQALQRLRELRRRYDPDRLIGTPL